MALNRRNRGYGVRFALIACLVTLLGMVGLWLSSNASVAHYVDVPPTAQQCQSDEACTYVEVNCAGCCSYTGIHKDYAAAHRDRFRDHCEDYDASVCECTPRGPIYAACEEGRCVVKYCETQTGNIPPYTYEIDIDNRALPDWVRLTWDRRFQGQPDSLRAFLQNAYFAVNYTKYMPPENRPAIDTQALFFFETDPAISRYTPTSDTPMPDWAKAKDLRFFKVPGLPDDMRPVVSVSGYKGATEFAKTYPYGRFAARTLEGPVLEHLNQRLGFVDAGHADFLSPPPATEAPPPEDRVLTIPFYYQGRTADVRIRLTFTPNAEYDHVAYRSHQECLRKFEAQVH